MRAKSSALLPSTVIVVDTLGELENFYALADLVFVGGSLFPRGGHNLLEPAAMGKPVLVGPHTYNFDAEVSLLKAENAAVQVRDEQELRQIMESLVEDGGGRQRMGQRAVEQIQKHRGASRRTVEAVESRLVTYGLLPPLSV